MLIVEKARAKINLALHVLGRRSDGYHALDSIVGFADVADELHVVPARETRLSISGPFADRLSTGEDNLVLRAVRMMQEIAPLPPIALHLVKNLPIASGIGGGSADAAAALRALALFANVPLGDARLQAVAIKLGADVPVCLAGQACRMGGIGERIEGLSLPLPSHIVLVNPLLPCATAQVFQKLGLAKGQDYGTRVDANAPETWRNDLTFAALEVVPEIGDCLQALRRQSQLGAVRMSGSGATCFGLAGSAEAAAQAAEALSQAHPSWWVRATELAVGREL